MSFEPHIDFDYPDDEPPEAAPASADSLSQLLTMLLAGSRDAQQVGMKAILLASLVRHPHAPATIRGLAERMKISPATAWRMKQAFAEDLGRIRAKLREDETGD